MAGSAVEDYGTGGSSSCIEGMSNEQRCLSTDSLVDWRTCDQVENGTPSTSPPYWDTDDDDDVCGAKPSDLYGKSTWKIENFSQITKRELRSNAFDVGGYKWYILIYPQGCDVSNHLSLFLCVANHDKLLPGWSHFAQFTIAVVNKDPKKSKYSDTLHRFWKKEHDWGWKKFMELSKVSDGFIVADTLVIKAQVQVIREKAHRPFRCLDRHYRRELVRVYLSNVEQICRRFVEERRGKLRKLIEDKMRWSSFRAFWLGIDQITRRRMSRDKTDTVLKVAVKHFFVEKEVTSTLVMDSLYSGLKALECQSKNMKGREKLMDMEELPAPMVYVEEDMFVLSDDVVLLLERAALELLPHQPSPPKDDKGSQNRTKESSGEELMKDSIVRDERRLTELGRRTVEIFILAHIFSRIEIAYQEVVALKRQEELIREEAAGLIQNELKAKRGATEKEKRTKKKQGKQKRNTRKGKDRGRDEKSDMIMQDKHQPKSRLMDLSSTQAHPVIGSMLEATSDPSDAGDDVPEALQPELDDRDTNSVNWDTDISEIQSATEPCGSERQNGQSEKRSPSIIDDSCSTCSTDSVPSVVINGPYKGNSLPNNKSQMSPARVNNHRSRDTHDRPGFTHGGNNPNESTTDATHLRGDTGSYSDSQNEPETAVLCLKDRIQRIEKHLAEKEEVLSPQNKFDVKDQVEVERPYKSRSAVSSSPSSPWKTTRSGSPQSMQAVENISTTATTTGIVCSKEVLSINPARMEKSVPLVTKSLKAPSTLRSEAQKFATSKSTAAHQVPAMSRPSSAPLNPSPRPAAPVVSTVQTMPLLSSSVSAVGRLGTDPSPSAPNYVPRSYRNAIVGKTSMNASSAAFTPLNSASSSQVVARSQSASAFQSFMQSSARNSPSSLSQGFTFGSVKPETLHNQHSWRDNHYPQQEASTSSGLYGSHLANYMGRIDIYGRLLAKQYSGEVSSGVPSAQVQGTVSDEFPHIAIINDLLDEDQSIGKAVNGYPHPFNRQYTFPCDTTTVGIGSLSGLCWQDQNEQYYGEDLQRTYGSSNSPFHGQRDGHLGQMEFPAYADSQIDGVIPHQWPYNHADSLMLNLGNVDANGYSYQLQEYLNSTCLDNAYNMYRSTGGL